MLTQHITAAAATAPAFDVLGVTVSFLSVFTNAERVNLGLSGAAKYRIVFDMSERDAAFKNQQQKQQLCATKGVFFFLIITAHYQVITVTPGPLGERCYQRETIKRTVRCKRYFFQSRVTERSG